MVGDRVVIESVSPSGLEALFDGENVGYDGPRIELEVVGIARPPEEITGGSTAIGPLVFMAQAFFEEWSGELGYWDGIYLVDLEDGFAGVEAFEAAVRAEFAGRDDVGIRVSAERERIGDTVAVQTLAFWLLAVASGVAGAVAVVQAVGRFVRDDTAAVALALGASRRGRSFERALVAGAPVLIGAVAAVGGAVLVSSRFPTGAIRRVDPSSGVSLDSTVLGIGVVVVLLLSTAAAHRSDVTARTATSTPARLVDRLARLSASVAISTGLRRALASGRGGDVGPARAALLASIAGVVGLTGAVVFGASLDRLVDDPRAFGFNWDLSVGLGDELDDEEALAASSTVEGDDRITGASMVRVDNVLLEGREAAVFALESVTGAVEFTVVEGRSATGNNEVTLGASTMDELGVAIGDVVGATDVDGGAVPLTIVGQSLFPVVEHDDPAQGAGMRLDTYLGLLSPGAGFPELYVHVADGAAIDEVTADLGEIGVVNGVVAPPVIDNLRGVDSVPWFLAGFLAVLALGTVMHALLASVRRRQHEFAVLKALGSCRRQLATSMIAQTLTFAVLGLVVGVPIGMAAGRQAWRAVAGGLGFARVVDVPIALALLAPLTLAVVLAVGIGPAMAAGRTPAAELLRSE